MNSGVSMGKDREAQPSIISHSATTWDSPCPQLGKITLNLLISIVTLLK